MTCVHNESEQAHLIATSTDVLYYWFTGWQPAIGLDDIKSGVHLKGISGNIQARLAIQVANVRTDNPSTPAILESSYSNTQDRCTGVLDVSATTSTPMFVRFGVAYNLSSGTTPGQADVSVDFSWPACGQAAGGGTFALLAPDTNSRYQAISGWIPAIFADIAKAAIVVTATIGNFRCQLAYRTATSFKESTSGWSSNLEELWHGGNGEYTTGEKTLSASSSMWVQVGIEYSLSSGTNGSAQVSVAAAVRRA